MTLDMQAFAGAMARAITDKTTVENKTPQLLPTTVISYEHSDTPGGARAIVHIVGDPQDRTLQVPVISGTTLETNDIVMVMFDPPEGAYVWSRITPVFEPATATVGARFAAYESGIFDPPSICITGESSNFKKYGTIDTSFGFRIHTECTAQITMEIRISNLASCQVPASPGEIAIGTYIDQALAGSSATFDSGLSFIEAIDGRWVRTAFDCSATGAAPIGVTTTRTFRVDPGVSKLNPLLLIPVFEMSGFDDLDDSVTLEWKSAVSILPPQTYVVDCVVPT